MSYKKNSYLVVKNAIPVDVANFVYDYFNMKHILMQEYMVKVTYYIDTQIDILVKFLPH